VRFVRWETAPTIIAEALVAVPDALLTALRPGAPASGAVVAAQLARSLGPQEHPAHPPAWLLPSQKLSFRRVLAAIDRYRGALLADPVGSGKTFIALAAAAEANHGSTVCLVPATLMSQWQAAAARVGVAVTLCSHERVSRGHLPRHTRGLVIIDESHHFRNPQTKRYRHLAPWLIGRSALLLTATPVVNRLPDLAHQLLLAVRDDALAADGVGSLRTLHRTGCAPAALGHLVFESQTRIESRPERAFCHSKAGEAESRAAGRLLTALGRLRLSSSETIAGLIRGVLLRAAGSSPAAYAESLRRYRRLLLHAGDAMKAGRTIDRQELKRFTRELDDQLVWWELMPISRGQSEIEIEDLDQLNGIIGEVEPAAQESDPKLDRLRALLLDGVPTLVFTASRHTVWYVRDHLAQLRIAWCTGDKAGIGTNRLSRSVVLDWFRAPTDSPHAPRHLVVTDVAAEGLNLQRVARVIHYDLPWTPMRMEQREGRAVRYGSQHSQVQVVQFELPPLLERRLRVCASLARKHGLPAAAGLGPSARHIWQWRAELASRFRGPGCAGLASVEDAVSGLLAGFAIHRAGEARPLSCTVLWIGNNGSWTEDPEIITAGLESAARQQNVHPADSTQLSDYLSMVAGRVRERLAFIRSRRWIVPDPNSTIRSVVGRLQSRMREAARQHDPRRLLELERAMGFITSGLTAGEASLIDQLAKAGHSEFDSLILSAPIRRAESDQLEVRLTGLVVFGPAKIRSDPVPSPECPGSRPSSSTSMEP
jgi:superfamily II DNA or RNA helicase